MIKVTDQMNYNFIKATLDSLFDLNLISITELSTLLSKANAYYESKSNTSSE